MKDIGQDIFRKIVKIAFWVGIASFVVPFILVKTYASVQRIINVYSVMAPLIMFIEKLWLIPSIFICLIVVLLRVAIGVRHPKVFK